MTEKDVLYGKRVLIVDDEPDVLDTLELLLPTCDVKKATTFEEANDLLENTLFDFAILDIMGVNGYKLLEICNEKKVPAIMLTAHALSPDYIIKSYKEGAASYLPKDEMDKITTFLTDIIEAKQKGKSSWWNWFTRLGGYMDYKFGPDWESGDRDFWKKLRYDEFIQ